MARTPSGQSRRLNALIRQQVKPVRDAFTLAIQQAAGLVDEAALIRALERQDLRRAAEILRLDDALLAPLREAIRGAYVVGGQAAAQAAPAGVSALWAFDPGNPRAAAWVSRMTADLIQGVGDIEDGVRKVQSVVEAGLRDGRSHKSMARELSGRRVGRKRVGGVIGLDAQQTDAIMRQRSYLLNGDTKEYLRRYTSRDKNGDRTIAKALKEGRPLTRREIDGIIEANKAKAIGARARRIAKNEAHQAALAGQNEGIEQIKARFGATATIRWQHNLSQNPRDDHVEMDGTIIEQGQDFVFPDGTRMKYPGDRAGGPVHNIGCRCVGIYRIKVPKVD
jgi:hypothetical protein